MPWFDFFWYEGNLQHLADNHVTAQEFEEVVTSARSFNVSRSGADMVAGTTKTGRYLICVFRMVDQITILPITAYEPTRGVE